MSQQPVEIGDSERVMLVTIVTYCGASLSLPPSLFGKLTADPRQLHRLYFVVCVRGEGKEPGPAGETLC